MKDRTDTQACGGGRAAHPKPENSRTKESEFLFETERTLRRHRDSISADVLWRHARFVRKSMVLFGGPCTRSLWVFSQFCLLVRSCSSAFTFLSRSQPS